MTIIFEINDILLPNPLKLSDINTINQLIIDHVNDYKMDSKLQQHECLYKLFCIIFRIQQNYYYHPCIETILQTVIDNINELRVKLKKEIELESL